MLGRHGAMRQRDFRLPLSLMSWAFGLLARKLCARRRGTLSKNTAPRSLVHELIRLGYRSTMCPAIDEALVID